MRICCANLKTPLVELEAANKSALTSRAVVRESVLIACRRRLLSGSGVIADNVAIFVAIWDEITVNKESTRVSLCAGCYHTAMRFGVDRGGVLECNDDGGLGCSRPHIRPESPTQKEGAAQAEGQHEPVQLRPIVEMLYSTMHRVVVSRWYAWAVY